MSYLKALPLKFIGISIRIIVTICYYNHYFQKGLYNLWLLIIYITFGNYNHVFRKVYITISNYNAKLVNLPNSSLKVNQ